MNSLFANYDGHLEWAQGWVLLTTHSHTYPRHLPRLIHTFGDVANFSKYWVGYRGVFDRQVFDKITQNDSEGVGLAEK